jgi:hypothetical protein
MGSVSRLLALALFCAMAIPAADFTGIWAGQMVGRNDEKQDVAFQFKIVKDTLTGVMFGDEFDLPVQDLTVSGDRITFSVTTTNYYDMRRTKFSYAGALKGKELELTRERAGPPPDGKSDKPQNGKQTFTLKKLA